MEESLKEPMREVESREDFQGVEMLAACPKSPLGASPKAARSSEAGSKGLPVEAVLVRCIICLCESCFTCLIDPHMLCAVMCMARKQVATSFRCR